MRISDWSSDVCSSDLEEAEPPDVERPEVEAGAAFQNPLGHDGARPAAGGDAVEEAAGDEEVAELRRLAHDEVAVGRIGDRSVDELTHAHGEIGRASCRERVCQYV